MTKKDIYKRVLNQKGLTLVEVLLATVIGSIMLGAIYIATMEGHRASTGIEQKISVQEDVRAALDIMTMEIGMASYNPSGSNGIWRSTDCGAAGSGTATYKGIQAASTNGYTITVEADINDNGSVGAPDPNEIITYTFDPANQRITRNTNCGGTQSFIGDITAATNRQRNVRVVNNTLNIPVFTYFDSTGTQIPFANLPARIPDIRRIDVTLAVVAADPDFQGQTRQMIHSTSVIPRNHAIAPY